jgi:succinoglycan biosynthesis transport protein ExoP
MFAPQGVHRGIVTTIGTQSEREMLDTPDLSLQDILETLFRRRRVVLIFVLLSLGIAVALMLRPRQYTASGVIRVQPDTASMYRTSPMSLLSGEVSDKIATEADILQSRTLYLQVAKELDLVHNPAFWGVKKLKPQSLDDPKTREKLVRLMRKEIAVTHDPKDEIISASCTTVSPELSAKILNTLINDYVVDLFQMRYGSTQRTSKWLAGQLGDLKQQIENDQSEITELQKKLGVIGFDEKNAEYLQTESLDSMTKAASDATIARILAEAKLRYLQESNPNLIEGEVNVLSQGSAVSAQNSLLQNLRNQQAQASATYARLVTQFGPNYPDVKQVKAQLDEINGEVAAEQQRILNQASLSYKAASANEKMANSALKRQTNGAFNSRDALVRYVLLLHDYESHRTLYEGLVERLREATITSGLEAGEVDIVDLADLPALPNPPGPLLLLAGSLVAGLVFGCLAAFLWDAVDTRVTSAEQAERAANLPLLTVVPHQRTSKRLAQQSELPQLTIVAEGSRYTEAVQSLRSSILLAQPGVPPKVILVTSAIPAEGKSITATNLAATFARHRVRVLLVDCDLRRGSQAGKLRVDDSVGITRVLTGQITLDDAIQRVPDNDYLSILPAGPRPPDPAILIASQEMKQLIEQCAARFDFVILDSAPVLGLSDTVNLGQLAQAVILVVREGFSSRKAIGRAVERMVNSRFPVIGFVLNDVDLKSHPYSEGYGYAYGRDYQGYYLEAVDERK